MTNSNHSNLPLSEEALDYLEEQIPELAKAAVRSAYWSALASGHSVVHRDGDFLVETYPDGTRRVIEPLPPLGHLEPGRRFTLKR